VQPAVGFGAYSFHKWSVKSVVDQHILAWSAAVFTLLIGIGGVSWYLEWEKLALCSINL